MGITSFTMNDDNPIPLTTTDAGLGAPSDEYSLSAGAEGPLLVGLRRLGLNLLQQLLVELGLALLAPGLGQLGDLGLVDIGALDPLEPGGADRREQHVALAEQRFGAVVVEDPALGEVITVRSMVYLALTYDHRIVDGADAARFLTTLKARLEEGAFETEFGL